MPSWSIPHHDRSFVKQSRLRNAANAATHQSMSTPNTKTSSSATNMANKCSAPSAVSSVGGANYSNYDYDDDTSFWTDWADEVMQEESSSQRTQQISNTATAASTAGFESRSFQLNKDDLSSTTVNDEDPSVSIMLDVSRIYPHSERKKSPTCLKEQACSNNTSAAIAAATSTASSPTMVAPTSEQRRESIKNSCTNKSNQQLEQDEDKSMQDTSLYTSLNDGETTTNMDTSMNTVAAMNITQATVNVEGLNNINNPNDVSLTDLAMELTAAATEHLQAHDYEAALRHFQQAVDCYETQAADTNSVLALVNGAGCLRNMSAVCRKQNSGGTTGTTETIMDQAADYLRRAQELYVRSLEAVQVKSSETILTLDGKMLEDSRMAGPDVSVNQQGTSCTEEFLCLDATVLETLQSRADMYLQFQGDKEQAIDCHEQALKHLLHLNKLHQWDASLADSLVRQEGVSFVPLQKQAHTTLLVKSLETLGGCYRAVAASQGNNSTYSASLLLFEDALDILQTRLEEEDEEEDKSKKNDDLIHIVARILRDLSEIYFRRQELDRAVAALHDSTSVKLSASGEPNAEALEVMEKYGAANESMENWEKALSCYEQTLFARSKFYGNTHLSVAKSLVNVARVMEKKDGSTDESADLLKAANAIFALQATTESPDLGWDVKAILELIPTVIRQGKYAKAVEDLNKCLIVADSATKSKANKELNIDKAQINFDLGRAYMGLKDYKKATECLMQAVEEAGNANDEEIFSLLQHVEFLQRTDKHIQGAVDRTLEQHMPPAEEQCSFRVQGDISFQLQGDPSMYIFEDSSTGGPNQRHVSRIAITGEDDQTEVQLQSPNPHHDILYHSFVQDHGPSVPVISNSSTVPKNERASMTRTMRERVMSPLYLSPVRNIEAVADNDSSSSKPMSKRAKLGKKIGKQIKRLHKACARKRKKRAESRNGEARPRRENLLARANCFKQQVRDDHGDELRSPTTTRSPAAARGKSADETIIVTTSDSPTSVLGSVLSEMTSRCFPSLGEHFPISTRSRSHHPACNRIRKVMIKEEENGFATSHLA